jgi:secondary thiamine-phosphate synthase enzyme
MILDRSGARAVWPRSGRCHREEIEIRTQAGLEFVDVTDRIAEAVDRSGIADGIVCVQSLHTTAAVVVNEAEPLLLEDLRAALERAAPCALAYGHDDFERRAAVPPDEPANGHAHCKALFLRASETLAVADGQVRVGRWQRVFLVELDGPRTRTLGLTVLGA